MKKLLTCLLILFALAFAVTAQDTLPRKKGYFGIAIGAGFPLQDFVKKDFNNDRAGFANTGSNLQLNYQRCVSKRFGILARGNINTNPYDVYELAKSYNTRDTFSNYNYTVNSKNWYCAGIMLGLNYAVPIREFTIGLHALAGFQYAESPEVRVTLSTGTDSTTVKLSKGTTIGLVWTAGADVSYRISNKISVAAGVEYYTFKGTFRNSKILVDEKPIADRTDFDMHISIINATAAVRYHF